MKNYNATTYISPINLASSALTTKLLMVHTLYFCDDVGEF